MENHLLTIILGLIFMWLGSSVAIAGINTISKRINRSSFLISFFLLGLFTSLSEVSVAINSVIDTVPQVAVGNLLGGIIVLFLLIIPLLGIFGNGIHLQNRFPNSLLFFSLLYLFSPFIFLLDQGISPLEGFILVISYFILAYLLFRKNEKKQQTDVIVKIKPFQVISSVVLILIGIVTLFISSDFLLKEVIYFAGILQIKPLLLSLVLLSLGTNLPEFAIGIRSLLSQKKDIAFGNYIGSAMINLLILGIVAIYTNGVTLSISLNSILVFTLIGFIFFFYFSRTGNVITRRESFFLVLIYIIFLIVELFIIT